MPWNADGRYLLALQVPFQDRLPGAGDAAEVCLNDRDPATGKAFTVLFDISADGGRGGRPEYSLCNKETPRW